MGGVEAHGKNVLIVFICGVLSPRIPSMLEMEEMQMEEKGKPPFSLPSGAKALRVQ